MRVPKLLPGMFLLIGGLLVLSGFDQRLLAANAGGLAGIVKDSRGAPLAGVAVTLLRGQFNPKVVQTVTTDGTGRFEMRELVPGFYSLKANLASYLPFIQSQVGVVAGKIADLTLILENLYLQSILGVSTGVLRSQFEKTSSRCCEVPLQLVPFCGSLTPMREVGKDRKIGGGSEQEWHSRCRGLFDCGVFHSAGASKRRQHIYRLRFHQRCRNLHNVGCGRCCVGFRICRA